MLECVRLDEPLNYGLSLVHRLFSLLTSHRLAHSLIEWEVGTIKKKATEPPEKAHKCTRGTSQTKTTGNYCKILYEYELDPETDASCLPQKTAKPVQRGNREGTSWYFDDRRLPEKSKHGFSWHSSRAASQLPPPHPPFNSDQPGLIPLKSCPPPLSLSLSVVSTQLCTQPVCWRQVSEVGLTG